MKWSLASRIALLVLLGACGSSAPSINAPGRSVLSFSQCPKTLGGRGVECARVRVPIHWGESEGRLTTLLVRRLRAPGPSKGQVWALDGGPGFAGDVFLDAGFVKHIHDAGLDLYVPSHRGTRDDSRLSCPAQSSATSPGGGRIIASEWPACRAHLEKTWGQGLPAFSSAAAATDVIHLMGRVPKVGRRLLFGGSYGSLWAQRILQQRPVGLDGVWLDSIVSLDASLERTDENGDAAMARLLERCADIPTCRAKFVEEPLATARKVIAAYREGTGCGQNDKSLGRAALQLLMNRYLHGPPSYWQLAITAWAKASRCQPEDLEWLVAQSAKLQPPKARASAAPPAGYSVALNRVLLYRELYRFDSSADGSEQEGLLASGGVNAPVAEEAAAFGTSWRRPGSSAVPTTKIPIVLLSGELDPLDPPEWAEKAAKQWPSSTLVSVPWAGHSVLRYLGVNPGQCGARMLAQFLAGQSLDTSCVAGVIPKGWATP